LNITDPDDIASAGQQLGSRGENNEVESSMQQGQMWDLEMMDLTNGTLSLIGGWKFDSGIVATISASASRRDDQNLGGGGPQNWDSGDIFLAINGPEPWSVAGSGNTNYWGYHFVIDVQWLDNGSPGTYTVYQLDANSTIYQTVDFGAAGNIPRSDPWRYAGGGTSIYSGTWNMASNVPDQGSEASAWDVGQGPDNQRYSVGFDLTQWLVLQPGETLYAHFTMECGNDVLRGHYDETEGGQLTPEPGTFALLGLVLAGLGIRSKLAKK
jgi:hypothetical protein